MDALYKEYLKSSKWKKISDKCKDLAGNVCNRCGSKKELHAHHLTYANVGKEKQEDLECLCNSCHEKVHNKVIGYHTKPSYIMVASGYKRGSMNYTKELLAMDRQEAFLFNILMDNRKSPDESKPYIRSNYTEVDSAKLTKSEKKKVYEGYKKLHGKQLIIRTSRGKYLINPNLVITNDDLYTKELQEWDSLLKTTK